MYVFFCYTVTHHSPYQQFFVAFLILWCAVVAGESYQTRSDDSEKDRARRTAMAREELSRIAWPKRFGTCLTSLHMCSGINIDRCKVMDSKQAPLWIEFINADPHGTNIKVMFKVGDDLRQDQMTLQFLELLDRKSLPTGVDLCMRPYKCMGTGCEVGMVEMVPISDTIARMQWAGGGLTTRSHSSILSLRIRS